MVQGQRRFFHSQAQWGGAPHGRSRQVRRQPGEVALGPWCQPTSSTHCCRWAEERGCRACHACEVPAVELTWVPHGLRPLLVLFMSAALAQGGSGYPREQDSAIPSRRMMAEPQPER